jgi:hypothetical protein
MSSQFDLLQLIRSVTDGDLKPAAAIEQLKLIPSETIGEAVQSQFADELAEVMALLETETSHLRVYDAGRVIIEVAAKFAPALEWYIAYRVGQRLLNLGEDSFALDPLRRAEVLLQHSPNHPNLIRLTPMFYPLRVLFFAIPRTAMDALQRTINAGVPAHQSA